jgi:hypothetical protein
MIRTITRLFSSTQRNNEIEEDRDSDNFEAYLAGEMKEFNSLSKKDKKEAQFQYEKDRRRREQVQQENEIIEEFANARETLRAQRTNTVNRSKLMSMDEIKAEAKRINKRGYCFFR